MRKISLLFIVFLFSVSIVFGQNLPITQGTLSAFGEGGDLGRVPLKHTKVKTDISGFLARVNVSQEFENNFNEPIEAVYTFPLSQNAAVDDMTMKIGSRNIKGKIMKREEARKVYENAKAQGQTASLLDQERPNIFTQSVANILPGENIVIEISYVETLKYEDGSYEFVFPMVVGPRYIPGNATGKQAGGFAPDTKQVPDGSKITPQIARTRAGHDISIEVNLDAGVPIENVSSTLHQIESLNLSSNSAKITLKSEKTIPNKDFVLRYDVTGKKIEDAILTHRGQNGGFFTMILQPPDKFTNKDITPKEIVFVLDTSGSMSGFPIEKAKEAMKLSLDGLHPNDTFNLITFAGDTHVLFEKPVQATSANLAKAQAFLSSRSGGGGTEMMKAITTALAPSNSNKHIRIVCFMTDGYVGNEGEILSEIQKYPNARVFSFGIGNSVNRFLLDKMAEEGRGEVEYVLLNADGSKAAKKFYERVRTPLLTDISIDWNGLPVADVYPSRLSDLFSAKPVILNGRYTNAANGTVKLKGKVSGQYYEREIAVNLPESNSEHDVLATLWARQRVDDLTSKGYRTAEDENAKKEVQDQITNLGLEFRLLTQFTSFVAVEERVVNRGGQPRKIEVPIEMADGVGRETTVGGFSSEYGRATGGIVRLNSMQYGGGQGSGGGRGSGKGVGSPPAKYSVKADEKKAFKAITVDSTSAQVNVSENEISSLPVNSRNVSGFSIDGSSGSENVFVVDGTEVTNFRTERLDDKNKERDEDTVAGISTMPKPKIPKDAKWNKEDSKVEIEIAVDEQGKVVSAKATSGNPVLQKASETAALQTQFVPPRFENEPLEMSGVITYEFVDATTVKTSLGKMRVKLTPEIERKILFKEKLHFWILELVARLDKGETTPTPNEANFVFNGKAEVQIILTEKTPEIIEKLKASGFEIDEERGTKIIGRIAVEKLDKLVEIKQVKYVSP